VKRMRLFIRVSVLATLPAAVFAQTLNLSQDLVRLGIASANMVPNQRSLDSRPLFEQGVA
jgi:hypothetical protein